MTDHQSHSVQTHLQLERVEMWMPKKMVKLNSHMIANSHPFRKSSWSGDVRYLNTALDSVAPKIRAALCVCVSKKDIKTQYTCINWMYTGCICIWNTHQNSASHVFIGFHKWASSLVGLKFWLGWILSKHWTAKQTTEWLDYRLLLRQLKADSVFYVEIELT